MGAALGPQLVGVVTDAVVAMGNSVGLAQGLGLTVEQLGMKLGLAVGTLFPLLSIFVFLRILRTKDKVELSPLEK